MNKSAIVVLLVLSFSLGLFGQENEVKLQNSDSELTDDIIRQAFSQLGLTMYSYSCDLKTGDEITFSVEQYKNGKKKDSVSFGKLETTGNSTYEFTLFIRRYDNGISFTQGYKTNEYPSGTSSISFSIKKYNASISYPYKPILKSGKKTMVNLLMMNKNSIRNPNTDSIEEIVMKYDMVFIVYITLNEEKNYDLSK